MRRFLALFERYVIAYEQSVRQTRELLDNQRRIARAQERSAAASEEWNLIGATPNGGDPR